MSEARQPPKDLWWRCHACGQSNGPRDRDYCSLCGREKKYAMDAERWEKFFTADAVVAGKEGEDADAGTA